MKGPVEVISDEIFCFNFSGTELRDFVAIHNHVHQQPGAAAHGDSVEGQEKPQFCPFHSEKLLQQAREVAGLKGRLPAG